MTEHVAHRAKLWAHIEELHAPLSAPAGDPIKVAVAVGHYDNFLALELDVTSPRAQFLRGFFEELSPEQIRNQIETPLSAQRSRLRNPHDAG